MLATAASTTLAVVAISGAASLPYFLLRKRGGSNISRCFSFISISSCNCFACGVFLATCFLGLIPHTQMNEAIVRRALAFAANTTDDSGSDARSLVTTELVILLGILLMLLIEQFFAFCYLRATGGDHFPLSHDALFDAVDATLFNDAYYSKRLTKSTNSMSSFCAPSTGNTKGGSVSQKLNRGGGERADAKQTRGDFEPLVDFGDLSTDEELERVGSGRDDEQDDEFGSIEFRSCHYSSLRKNQFLFGRGDSVRESVGGAGGIFQMLMLLLAISTHSVFEGIALGAQQTVEQFLRMLLSVMLHEVLCCFSFSISLSSQDVSPRAAVLSTLFLALSIPAGMLVMTLIGRFDGIPALFTKFALEGLSAGIFIYVACVKMLAPEFAGNEHSSCHTASAPSPAAGRSKGGLTKALAVCFGALVAAVFGVSVRKL